MKFRMVAVIFMVCLFSLVANNLPLHATTNASQINLTLDRESVSYLFDIPKTGAKECLYFKWVAKGAPSAAGQLVVLQFSQDGTHWQNLANAIVNGSGVATRSQPVDSGWAVPGKTYLRAVIGTISSNVVIIKVNSGIGYWIFVGVFVSFSMIIALTFIRKKRIVEVKIPEGISSWINRHIQGREKLLYLLIGLMLGVLIAPWTEQRFDCYVNRLWCSLIYGYSLYPFEPKMPPGYPLILRYSYPPIWLLILLSIFRIWLWLTEYKFPANPTLLWKHGVEVNNIYESYRSFVPQSLPLLDFLLKLPNVIAYVGIGWLLLNFTQDTKNSKAILFLWILNPFVIQIATVWGLNDSLCTFFALGSVYFLWKHRTSISAIFLSFSFGTKLWPIFFLVPILIYIYRNQGSRASLKYLITFAFVSCLILSSFLPFPGGLKFLLNIFFFKFSPDWYGRNLFSGITLLRYLLLLRWKSNFPIFPIIFVPAYVGFNYIFWKGKVNFNSLVTCLASILLLAYLSYTVVNPQYIFWILPFLLYMVTEGGFSKKLYIVLSLIPLIWTLGVNNLLYFISPTIVWDEANYPPWSDIILQLQSIIFTDFTQTFLVLLFTITALVSLVLLLKKAAGKS